MNVNKSIACKNTATADIINGVAYGVNGVSQGLDGLSSLVDEKWKLSGRLTGTTPSISKGYS